MGSGVPLGASWEPLRHHRGSKTPPASSLGGFGMGFASIVGDKIDQESINMLFVFTIDFGMHVGCMLDGF